MKTTTLKPSDIKPNPDNPRIIRDDQFKKLVQSLKDFPEMADAREVVVNTDHVILGGNMRFRAMVDAGWTQIPVKIVDWPIEKQREFVIKDNVSGGEWDYDMLANQYELVDLDAWGLDLPKDMQLGDDAEQDDLPELSDDPPVSKLGEIYQLGRHRIMCGDSTDAANVELLMNGAVADIGFTSPPYNAGDNVRGNFYANDDDDKTSDEYTDFITDTAMITLQYTDFSFINLQMLEGNKLSLIDFQTNMRDYIKDILVWNKSTAPPHINKGTFATKWEYIFAFSKQSKSRSFPASWQGKFTNVIETENNSGNEFAKDHKAGFPVALPLWIINRMDFAKSVLDIFIGTGTTVIACEQTNRTCYGMEIDPKYVDVARKRYWKFVNNGDESGWENETGAIITVEKQ